MAMGGISLAPLLTQIKVDISNFKTQMQQAATAGVAAAKDMSEKMSKAANVGNTLKGAGESMTRNVTLPILGAAAAATKFALDAEQSFAKVGTILDTTVISTDELKKGVMAASNESGIAVTDFNEALYETLSAGVDSGNAIKFTTDMAKLAKGGFTETSKAVDVVTSVLNAYGLSADQATSISDKLIVTQNVGKTTVDQLASSLGKVIPTANAFGVNIDNVSAAMAQLTKNGIQTAEATTYYNSMLNELGSSGTIADKTLRELAGKGFSELTKEGKKLPEILQILKDKADSSGKSLLDMFGSTEAAKAALTIMKDGGVEYNDILGQMQNSAGATQKAFDGMNASPLEQLKKTMNELKNAGITLGVSLIPAITKVANVIKTLAEKFQSLTPEQQAFIAKTGLLVAAIGPIIAIVGKAILLFTQIAPIVSGASAAIASAGGVSAALGVALTALTGPIGITIAIVAALALAFATNFGGIRDTVMSVMSSVSAFISSIMSAIKYAWETNFMGIQTYVTTVFNAIAIVVNTVLNAVKGIFDAFSAAFKGDWQGCWDAIKGIFSTVWEGIKSYLFTVLNGMVDTILNIGVSLYTAGQDAFTKIKEGASAAWETLKGWIEQVKNDPVNTILGLGSAMLNAGKNIINSILDGAKSAWTSVGNWFDEKVQWIKNKVQFWNDSKGNMGDGGGDDSDGFNYNGLSYVPFDGYNATLHKGERVLTADENKGYNPDNGSAGGFALNIQNFNNNRKTDVKQLAEEFEFYRKTC